MKALGLFPRAAFDLTAPSLDASLPPVPGLAPDTPDGGSSETRRWAEVGGSPPTRRMNP